MPDPLLVLPDPILVLIQYLRARPEITALVPAASIVTALPTNPVGQYVLLTWAGGQGIWPAVDDAAIQIDTMYGDKAACSLLMRTVRAAVWAIRNDTVAAGSLGSAIEELPPQWLPDTVPVIPISRFMARFRVLIFP